MKILTFDKFFKVALIIILASYVWVTYLNGVNAKNRSRYRVIDNRLVLDTYTGDLRVMKIVE